MADPAEEPKESSETFASLCPQEKMVYERCFQDWYANEFLRLTPAGKTLPCPDLYQRYRACVKKNILELGLEEDVEEMVKAFEDERAEEDQQKQQQQQ